MLPTKQVKFFLAAFSLLSIAQLYSSNNNEVTTSIQTNNSGISASSTFYYDAQNGGHPFYANQIITFMNNYQADLVFGKELGLSADEQAHLNSLQTKYLPVTVTIKNNSDTAITIPQNGYINELAPYTVPVTTILNAYPSFSSFEKNMHARDVGCFVGAPLALIVGILLACLAHKLDNTKASTVKNSHHAAWWVTVLLSALSCVGGFFAGGVGIARSMNMPPTLKLLTPDPANLLAESDTNFFRQMDLLFSRLTSAHIVDTAGNPVSTVQSTNTYTIPSYGKLTQLIFLDATSFNGAGMPATLTLNYQ